ncbi:MAG TPA: alkaline phosphatase family protein [Allosphingosinicella sp.]|nr:alkaline phosphatase family protein [Allosphingosinicella sp.]
MLKRAALTLLLSVLGGAAFAQPAAPAPRGPPRLVVAISVDQLSADLFAQYRQHFTGGLRRLTNGAVFPSGYQSHAATETCPGHSTILTGSRPSRTGIIANNWFDQSLTRDDEHKVYCAEDPRVAGSTAENYTVSHYFLRVPALGDHMKRANPASRVAVVAGKDRAAIMMGGRGPDQSWWWRDGAFTSHEGRQPTQAVTRANAAIAAAIARPGPALDLSRLCEARSRAVPLGGGGAPVGQGRFAREAGNRNGFRASPEFDGATLALAMAMRDEMRLGQGRATDLLIVGLSATDYIGHTYGTQGSEMCLQLTELDRSLGDFFDRLDRTGVDYLVVLTADHGGLDVPERIGADGGLAALRVDPALGATTMGRAIGAALGIEGPVLIGDGPFGDIYVDRALPAAVRTRALDEAARRYRAHPQVAWVFNRAELQAAPSPSGPPDGWTLTDRARASFDPDRSGDLIVLLQPRVMPIADTSRGYAATHGSPWDYDRRVPILFWRRGMRPFEQPLAVETVDILPTLAAMIGVSIPAGTIDGRCLDLVEGPESSCAAR